MTQIVDRRFSEKNKSAVNRTRFIDRFKHHIKKSITDAIAKRSITDIEKGEKIFIPAKDLSEPHFRYGQGGRREFVHPYNKDFTKGDKIKRPSDAKGGGGGSQASNENSVGSDEFGFELSREEFLNLFFEDLALPDLIKKKFTQTQTFSTVRAGYKKTGTPSTLDLRRSMRNALARRIAFGHNENKKVPFLDPVDLRYRNIVSVPKPSTQAVMFCLMDVSGSMDETRKELAKRFFILLYLFLTRTYQKIELVFIRHHTTAKEVDEHEFFYSRETGGTVVSSALELMLQIIRARYPSSEWNIYAAQASDGDNWNADSPHCADVLISQLMPCLQYFAYIEILPQVHQNLWESYSEVEKIYKHFAMRTVDAPTDIYPVFRELFRKKLT